MATPLAEEPIKLSNLARFYQSKYERMLQAYEVEDYETYYG
jgi:hypothetical protein